ncbi:hypothetical protein [Lactonifactor longoviformis]|uniref:hypothetical protein n=1 Tax=Lactonifactor longoviformis TaxID=341220 RepID=UPI001D032DCB|nr:hypothetical protein [Lactonifactor longoviformis]MCB5712123.1 hypothetical protein [Lactonifactor longoviformis]MCB5716167.1 hypothetical protein [Lactonifactor longoviformis]
MYLLDLLKIFVFLGIVYLVIIIWNKIRPMLSIRKTAKRKLLDVSENKTEN